ncbi:MAG: MoxR family ATPase [Planctomycetota bacterium]
METKATALAKNIEQVFVGKSEVVRNVLVAFLAGGHVLVEDVPGVGKTVLARALAKSVNCAFRRIQFTPDLLPSDILGVSVFNQAQDSFTFKPGPVFANVVLADEINRTTPRTQSSLLEAMNDFQVSMDGVTYTLPKPFVVIATQNPYEFEGTYALPENQLDRFLLCTRVGYPSPEDEKKVMADQKIVHPLDRLGAVMTTEEVVALQEEVKHVTVDDAISEYILRIVTATRRSEFLELGASPRGSLHLYRAAQALAVTEGRSYVSPDDVKALAPLVLAHRVRLAGPTRRRSSKDAEEVIRDLLDTVSVPI